MKHKVAPQGTTFAAFAQANPIKPKCEICNLAPDLRELIRKARFEEGGSYTRISAWLIQVHNVRLGESAVRNHFVRGHDKDHGE